MCVDLGLARLVKNLMFYENDKKWMCPFEHIHFFIPTRKLFCFKPDMAPSVSGGTERVRGIRGAQGRGGFGCRPGCSTVP